VLLLQALRSTVALFRSDPRRLWVLVILAISVAASVIFRFTHINLTFALDLAWRALHIFAASMGHTVLGYATRFIMVPAGVLLMRFARALIKGRRPTAFGSLPWERWKSNLTDAVVVSVLIAGVFYVSDVVRVCNRIMRDSSDITAPKPSAPPPPYFANNPPRVQPNLSAKCTLRPDLSACEIDCSVINHVAIVARDIAVGFQAYLPFDTKVAADADTRITLVKAALLPLPDAGGTIHTETLAFTIQAPIVAPDSSIKFKVWTASEDNQKACQEVAKMRELKRQTMREFYNAVKQKTPNERLPDLDLIFRAQAMRSSLFIPGIISSDAGRRPVSFIEAHQKMALAAYDEINKRLKPKFASIFANRQTCLAPVWTAQRDDGTAIYFWSLPPDSEAFMVLNKRSILPDGRELIKAVPFPPKEYYCK
jgi:hypothetical protein